MREQRQMAIEQVIHALERRFGQGTIYRLSQAKPKVGAIALSTGSLGLDLATGIHGVPRGRITELLGPPSCGKTTLSYHILANGQADGGMAAYIDAAQTMDGEAMLVAGVDLEALLIAVPRSIAEAIEIATILARRQALDAIVITVPPVSPNGRRAGIVFDTLGKLNTALKGSPTAMVLVDEWTMAAQSCVAQLPFYASLRIALAPLRVLRAPGGDVAGLYAQATVLKNKLAPPGGTAVFIIKESGSIEVKR